MSKWFQTPAEASEEPVSNTELGFYVFLFCIFLVILLLCACL